MGSRYPRGDALPRLVGPARCALDGPGFRWLRERVAGYRRERLRRFAVNSARREAPAVGRAWGYAYYPERGDPYYRVTATVQPGGPWPAAMPVRRPPLYRNPDGSWPPVPPGQERGDWVVRNGREWYRMHGTTPLRDAQEAVVWIGAHEAFHWLRDSAQVPGRNTEIAADAFADAWLAEYRAERTAA